MPRSYHGRLCNKAELAEIMGAAIPTINDWINKGMPFNQQGSQAQAWEFNTADVIDWRMDRVREQYDGPQVDRDVVSLREARRQKMQADAEKAILEVHKMRGEVISMEALEYQLSVVVGQVKAQLLAIPHKLSHKAAAMKAARDIEMALKTEITQALADLSTFEPDPETDIDDISA